MPYADPAKIKALHNTPERKRYEQIKKLSARYYISMDEAEIILDTRRTTCDICGAPEQDGRLGRLCYDHCYETGKFRGWLCRRCNILLGQAHEDPELLEALAAYLRR